MQLFKAAAAGAVLVALVLLLPSFGAGPGLISRWVAPIPGAGTSAEPSTGSGASTTSSAATVTIAGGPATPFPGYFGVNFRPTEAVGPTASAQIVGTAINLLRWPGGAIGDRFNKSTGVMYLGGGQTVKLKENEAQFVTWCRSIQCHTMFQVPAEINDPALAAWEVRYTEAVLGFYPDYWEIGNEPALWHHFGKPWSAWLPSDNVNATPPQYAQVVHRYVAAMRAIDPQIRIVGLPGIGQGSHGETGWIRATVAMNGPNLSAVAIHVYPAGSGSGGSSLSQFFGTLTGKGSIPARIPADRQAILQACPRCTGISIMVTELGAGSQGGGAWATYMASYPEVPYIGAELAQGLNLNVSNTDVFALQSTYAGSLYDYGGSPHPVDSLYSKLLSHFAPNVLPTTISPSGGGVYAAAAEAADRTAITLFAVNTNVGTTVNLSVIGPGFPVSGAYHRWYWDPTLSSVQNLTASGPTSQFTLGSEGVLVVSVPFTSSGPAKYPVTFVENGLPTGSNWSVAFQGNSLTSPTATIGFSAPNGTYPFVVGTVSGYAPSPTQGTVVVQGQGIQTPIAFRPTPGLFALTFLVLPSSCGSIVFNGTPQGNGSSLNFPAGTYSAQAPPCPGYPTLRWDTSGAITVSNASSASTTASVTGAGTLILTLFSVQPRYAVYFQLVPGTCSQIKLSGNPVQTGTAYSLLPGTYAIAASACPNYAFNNWTGTGGVSTVSPSRATTSVVVQGDGTLTAHLRNQNTGTGAFSLQPESGTLVVQTLSVLGGLAFAWVALWGIAYVIRGFARRRERHERIQKARDRVRMRLDRSWGDPRTSPVHTNRAGGPRRQSPPGGLR